MKFKLLIKIIKKIKFLIKLKRNEHTLKKVGIGVYKK